MSFYAAISTGGLNKPESNSQQPVAVQLVPTQPDAFKTINEYKVIHKGIILKASENNYSIVSPTPNPTTSPLPAPLISLQTPEVIAFAALCTSFVYKFYLVPLIDNLKDKLTHSTDYDEQIRFILIQYLALTKADRVCLAMYHNGEKYLNGFKYKKATITHEEAKPGVAKVGRFYRSVPLSQLTEFIAESDRSVHSPIAASKEHATEFAGFYMDDIGASTVLATNIKHSEHNIAMLSVHFNQPIKDLDNACKQLKENHAITALYNRLVNKLTVRQHSLITLIVDKYLKKGEE
jgi:hypothetical protein